jgi:HNH/ENDO VII superfamily nuclease with conserved GHE residues
VLGVALILAAVLGCLHADPSAATTTRTAAAIYNYDRSGPNAHYARPSVVDSRLFAPEGRTGSRWSANLPSIDFLAAKAGAEVVDVAGRRVTLRVGTKAEIREAAPRTASGDFIDPNTGQIISKDGPFDYGHKPGFEWWRTQQRARQEGWSRRELIEYENDPSHYQIEARGLNRSRRYQAP